MGFLSEGDFGMSMLRKMAVEKKNRGQVFGSSELAGPKFPHLTELLPANSEEPNT
jgi:hypothetical protein